jgi:C-terminal processing protease CtpA/Prc
LLIALSVKIKQRIYITSKIDLLIMSRVICISLAIILITFSVNAIDVQAINSAISIPTVLPNLNSITPDNVPLSEAALENLIIFGKLLGYIQYFYPSDEATKVNWEQFAIIGVHSVENAQSAEELINILHKLFQPYAPTIRIFSMGDKCHPLDINYMKPEVQRLYIVHWRHHGFGFLDNEEDWLHDYFYSERVYQSIPLSEIVSGDFSIATPFLENLGGGISACVPIYLYATETGTLPKSPPVKQSSNSISGQTAKLTGDDRDTRLADVIMAWNIFQHFYQYFDLEQVNWDKALVTALNEAATDINACAFKGTLQAMIARLHDGHGYVDMKNDPCNNSILFPNITLGWIENHVVITDAPPLLAIEKEGIERGDIVLAINGVPIEEAISRREKYISGATDESRRYLALQELLGGEPESKLVLTLQKPDGRVINDLFMRVYPQLQEFNYPARELLEPGIFYLNLSKLTLQDFVTSLPQLSQAKGIIFDLRGYPVNILITTLGYLSKTPLTSPQWGFPIVEQPDHIGMTFDYQTWSLNPLQPYLTAKKVFIANESAISLAETWLSIVNEYHLAEIVGEPSAGENCNAISEWLPGDYRITWSGCKVLNLDGTQFHGIGVQPTIPVNQTIQGIIEGRDELLEKAVEILR